MARYMIRTNLTRPRPSVILIHYEIRDDATVPHTVLESGTIGFRPNLAQTYQQNLTAMRTLFDTQAQAEINVASAIDNVWDQLLADTAGYRYPAAS